MPTPTEIEAQIASFSGKLDGKWGQMQPEREAQLIAEAQQREAALREEGVTIMPEPEVAVASSEPEKVDAPPPSDEVAGPEPSGSVAVPPSYPQRLRVRSRVILDQLRAELRNLALSAEVADLDRAILYLEAADEFEDQA